MMRPSRTSTQPTSGFGFVQPQPRQASSMARRMKRASSAPSGADGSASCILAAACSHRCSGMPAMGSPFSCGRPAGSRHEKTPAGNLRALISDEWDAAAKKRCHASGVLRNAAAGTGHRPCAFVLLFFHPDCNRWSWILTRSACAGCGCGHRPAACNLPGSRTSPCRFLQRFDVTASEGFHLALNRYLGCEYRSAFHTPQGDTFYDLMQFPGG